MRQKYGGVSVLKERLKISVLSRLCIALAAAGVIDVDC
jgi:hypothetical protein